MGRVGGRAISVLTQVLLARVLGAAAFGLYSIGYTLLRLGEIFVPLGLDQGVIHFGSRQEAAGGNKNGSVIRKSLWLTLLSGVVFGGLLWIAAPLLAHEIFQDPALLPVLRWIAPAVGLAAGLQVAPAATRISKRMQYAVITQDFIQPIFNLLLLLLLTLLGWQLFGALGALLASYAIALSTAMAFVFKLFPGFLNFQSPPAITYTDLLGYSLPISFAKVFGTSIMMLDRVIIGILRPSSEVGVYQTASLTATIFPIILVSFNAVFMPMIADYYHSGDQERLQEVFRVATRWGIMLGLPFYLLLVFFPGSVLTFIFGGEYAAGTIPLVLLASAQFINLIMGGVGILLTMTGKQGLWLRFSGLAFVLHVILSFLLIPRFGIAGGAAAASIAIVLLFSSGLYAVHQKLGLWPYDIRFRKMVLAAATIGIVLAVGRHIGLHTTFLSFSIMVVAMLLVYFLTLLLQGFEEEDRQLLALITRRSVRNR